mmetsp:Transcript_32048/g.63893  ORF Transcript_32048/g.63893 Transcript_32048/m.63893 type:complete len:271 (-) Transcript_32048:201-1013(-)
MHLHAALGGRGVACCSRLSFRVNAVKCGVEGEFEGCVRGDDRELLEVRQHFSSVRGPVPSNRDADLRAPPPTRVRQPLVHLHLWFVAVDVDVEDAVADRRGRHGGVGGVRASNLDRHAGAFLGPNESHLGPQTKLPAGLPHAVLGPAKHAAQHVGDVLVGQAAPVVAARHRVVHDFGPCVGLAAFAPSFPGTGLCGVFGAVVFFVGVVSSCSLLFPAFPFLCPGRVFKQACVKAPPSPSRQASLLVELGLGHLSDFQFYVRENLYRLSGI